MHRDALSTMKAVRPSHVTGKTLFAAHCVFINSNKLLDKLYKLDNSSNFIFKEKIDTFTDVRNFNKKNKKENPLSLSVSCDAFF